MSTGSIGSSTSFWQQDQAFWQQNLNDSSIAATDAVNNAMSAAEANLGRGLASIANSTALHRVDTELSNEIQNVLAGKSGLSSSSTASSPPATTTIPVAATGTGTAALSINTPLSLLGILSGGTITVSAGAHTTRYTSTGTDTVGDLLKAINANDFGSAAVTAALSRSGNLVITSKNTTDIITVGGIYTSNIGFGVGNNSFKPTKKRVPAASTPTPAPSKTSTNTKTPKSYATPATEMASSAASLLVGSGAAGSLVNMLA
jgi:hypothetical protein